MYSPPGIGHDFRADSLGDNDDVKKAQKIEWTLL